MSTEESKTAANLTESLPTIGQVSTFLALCSTLLLLTSAIYSTAYFFIVGREFQDLLSAQDYVIQSVYWIPPVALILGESYIMSSLSYIAGYSRGYKIGYASGYEKESSTKKDIDIKAKRSLYVLLGVSASFVVFLLAVSPISDLPRTAAVIMILVVSAVSSWAMLNTRFRDLFPGRTGLAVIPLSVLIPLVVFQGIADGMNDLKSDSTSFSIKLSAHDMKKIIPLKIIDKGVIYKDYQDSDVRFDKWADIMQFQRNREKLDDRTLLCKYTSRWC